MIGRGAETKKNRNMKTEQKTTVLTDDDSLLSARYDHGVPIPVYDDGYGPLWVLQAPLGIVGIVRAQTWEDAYSIAEDEFFPECELTLEEIAKEYDFLRETRKIIKTADGVERPAQLTDYPRELLPDGRHSWEFVRWETIETPEEGAWRENALFQEAYGFRPNGPNDRDTIKHGLYAKDLNGESLDLLTDKMLEDLGITLEIEKPVFEDEHTLPFSSLSEMLESREFQIFMEQKMGNDLFISDPDRADRCHEAAEGGCDGSTHGEVIGDWREFLGEFHEWEPGGPGCYDPYLPAEILANIKAEIDACELRLSDRLEEQVG